MFRAEPNSVHEDNQISDTNPAGWRARQASAMVAMGEVDMVNRLSVLVSGFGMVSVSSIQR
jgi:hypothetical protein